MIAGIYNNIQIDASGNVIASGNQDYALSQESGQVNYFSLLGTLIAITSIGDGVTNYIQVNPTTVLTLGDNFDNGGANDGTLAYIGLRTTTYYVSAVISYEPITANDVFVFALAKNGTASSKIVSATPLQKNTVTLVELMELTTNDEITVLVSNTTSLDDLTVFSFNLTVHG